MDEPSMGLAPLIIQDVARTIRGLKQDGGKIVLLSLA